MSSPPSRENCSLDPSGQTAPGQNFRIEDFEYDLPAEQIAQKPLPVRHASRLMRLDRQAGTRTHHRFSDLPGLLKAGDVLVVNDTRVIPARLYARRSTGGQVELLLLHPEPASPGTWQAMATPIRKLKEGEVLDVDTAGEEKHKIVVTAIITAADGQKRLLVDLGSPEGAYQLLSRNGYAPLPPYIRREADPSRRQEDLDHYQTLFARAPGAVAAPTAGLHFSDTVLNALSDIGVEIVPLTLHVGPGTFKPITSGLDEHTIEPEVFSIPEASAAMINCALASGRRVIPVGTTSLRALETAGVDGRVSAATDQTTSLYVRPGFKFRVTSGLLTNFHLSRSSLLVLVAAFAGHRATMDAYREAVEEGYRFYSYGDAMLIL